MSSFNRRAGVDWARLIASVDPAVTPGSAFIYAKDDAGVAQLFGMASDGSVYQLTPPVAVYAVTTPARALGVAFQPSATRMTLVFYSIRIEATLVDPANGAAGRVELLSDAANPPTTVRGRVAGGVTGTLAAGQDVSSLDEGMLVYLVPPGHFVMLQRVDEVATPTYTITARTEITL